MSMWNLSTRTSGNSAAIAGQHLDLLARLAGVDREDEYTFDTDDFPKVITADQVQDDEFCGAGHPLLED
jgi:hypothetical protein